MLYKIYMYHISSNRICIFNTSRGSDWFCSNTGGVSNRSWDLAANTIELMIHRTAVHCVVRMCSYVYMIMASKRTKSEEILLCSNKQNTENLGVLNRSLAMNQVVLWEAGSLIQTGSPIQARGSDGVTYKLGVMMYRCLHGLGPRYLAHNLTPASDVASQLRLRSANRHQLIVPRCRLNTYGCRAFSVAGLTVWNSLPGELRDPACGFDSFKQFLKTIFLVSTNVTSALEVFLKWYALYNFTFYLLTYFTYLLTYLQYNSNTRENIRENTVAALWLGILLGLSSRGILWFCIRKVCVQLALFTICILYAFCTLIIFIETALKPAGALSVLVRSLINSVWALISIPLPQCN